MGFHTDLKIENKAVWSDEFSAFNPDPISAAEETAGVKGWVKGYQLDAQRYPLMRAVPDVFPYPQFVAQMLKAAWKPAEAGKLKPAKQLAGQHRGAMATPALQKKGAYHPPVLSYGVNTDSHLDGVAKDWCRIQEFNRVEGYAFRGDTRDPVTVKSQGGFQPPVTRTDDYYLDNAIIPNFKSYMKMRFGEDNLDVTAVRNYIKGSGEAGMTFVRYEIWRSLMQQESMHLGRMIADEFMKGYISTSRSTSVAKAYGNAKGWVYVMYVKGAFLLGGQGTHDWLIFGEQELAMPGPVPWNLVFGFREVGADLKFTGPLYLRKHFHGEHKDSFNKVFELLSGKKQ